MESWQKNLAKKGVRTDKLMKTRGTGNGGGGGGLKHFEHTANFLDKYALHGTAKQGCHFTILSLKEKSLVTSLRNVSIIQTAKLYYLQILSKYDIICVPARHISDFWRYWLYYTSHRLYPHDTKQWHCLQYSRWWLHF